MEILIFSDSHGRRDTMRRAVACHPMAAYLLFCGDGLRDFEEIADENGDKTCYAVRGNCDIYDPFVDTPNERLVEIGGVKIWMLHGHTVGLNGGYGGAIGQALRAGADVLLCGHTHTPYDRCITDRETPLYVFNPGSIGQPYGYAYSYGVLTVRNGQFLLSHGQIEA